MIKGSLMLHLGPIWYHSEPSDVPYSQNLQFLGLDFSYSKTTLVCNFCRHTFCISDTYESKFANNELIIKASEKLHNFTSMSHVMVFSKAIETGIILVIVDVNN